MIFFLYNLCHTIGSLVDAIESNSMYIVTLVVIPIIIDLCENIVVRFEKFYTWLTLGVIRHREGIKHLIIFVDNFQS